MQETSEMTRIETAASRARRLWDGTTEGTATLLLKELLSADQEEAIAVLLPWITDRVRATMRTIVRDAEAGAWGEDEHRERRATAVRTQTGRLPVLGHIETLLKLPVIVPGKGYVLWRDMTIADHQARIGQLRKTVDGTMTTIGRHEWSISEIAKNKGAATLGDIPVERLDRDLP